MGKEKISEERERETGDLNCKKEKERERELEGEGGGKRERSLRKIFSDEAEKLVHSDYKVLFKF